MLPRDCENLTIPCRESNADFLIRLLLTGKRLRVICLPANSYIGIPVREKIKISSRCTLSGFFPMPQCPSLAGGRIHIQERILVVCFLDHRVPLPLILGELTGVADVCVTGIVAVRAAGL